MFAGSNFINYLMNKLLNIVFAGSLIYLAGCSSDSKQEATSSRPQKPDSTPAVTTTTNMKTIIFFGNSLTAGYGVDPSEAYPALIQNKIDSLKLKYKVINAGVSGETSAGGNGRVSWILKQPIDIFVLELGSNDGLRGIPVTETKKNLQSIIDKVKLKYPAAKLVLAGMQMPPNMGAQYATAFKNIFPELAEKNKMALIPFLLQGVGGEANLNQEDRIHPTAEGYKIVAENVWSVLKDEL
jgi:acyl-CoA thioesterase-1